MPTQVGILVFQGLILKRLFIGRIKLSSVGLDE